MLHNMVESLQGHMRNLIHNSCTF